MAFPLNPQWQCTPTHHQIKTQIPHPHLISIRSNLQIKPSAPFNHKSQWNPYPYHLTIPKLKTSPYIALSEDSFQIESWKKKKKKKLRAILSMACNPSHGLTTINIGPTPSCSDLAQMKTANKFLGEGKEVGWSYMDFQFLSLEIQPKCHHLGSLWSKGWFKVQFIFDDLEDHIWSTRFLVVHIEIGSRRGGNFCQAKSPDVTILWVWGRGLLWS